jgi:hypothetical protein
LGGGLGGGLGLSANDSFSWLLDSPLSGGGLSSTTSGPSSLSTGLSGLGELGMTSGLGSSGSSGNQQELSSSSLSFFSSLRGNSQHSGSFVGTLGGAFGGLGELGGGLGDDGKTFAMVNDLVDSDEFATNSLMSSMSLPSTAPAAAASTPIKMTKSVAPPPGMMSSSKKVTETVHAGYGDDLLDSLIG